MIMFETAPSILLLAGNAVGFSSAATVTACAEQDRGASAMTMNNRLLSARKPKIGQNRWCHVKDGLRE
jgi:hypothetical protein